MEIYLNNYYILQNIALQKRLEITVLGIIKECWNTYITNGDSDFPREDRSVIKKWFKGYRIKCCDRLSIKKTLESEISLYQFPCETVETELVYFPLILKFDWIYLSYDNNVDYLIQFFHKINRSYCSIYLNF